MHHNPHSSPHYTNGDAVIIIMGPPGSGKSTFINNIVQSGVATTDSGLDPCTQKFGWHLVPMKSPIYKTANHMGIRRIFLIDTPGIESAGLCQDIRGVLGRALKNGVVAVGLMYLCRYDRIREGDQVYMRAFKKLCEMDCHVLVGLTHLGAADAPQRASKALSHNTSWKPFLEATGADAVCLMDSAESAEVVLAGLLRSRPASKYGHDSSAIADEPGLLKFFKRLGNKVVRHLLLWKHEVGLSGECPVIIIFGGQDSAKSLFTETLGSTQPAKAHNDAIIAIETEHFPKLIVASCPDTVANAIELSEFLRQALPSPRDCQIIGVVSLLTTPLTSENDLWQEILGNPRLKCGKAVGLAPAVCEASLTHLRFQVRSSIKRCPYNTTSDVWKVIELAIGGTPLTVRNFIECTNTMF